MSFINKINSCCVFHLTGCPRCFWHTVSLLPCWTCDMRTKCPSWTTWRPPVCLPPGRGETLHSSTHMVCILLLPSVIQWQLMPLPYDRQPASDISSFKYMHHGDCSPRVFSLRKYCQTSGRSVINAEMPKTCVLNNNQQGALLLRDYENFVS